jgi:sulfotransferase family protein
VTTFPIIVGVGRSGTTLLRAMLDSHPQLSIPEESEFLVSLGKGRRNYEHGGAFDGELFMRNLFAHFGFRRWGLSEDAVRQAFVTKPPNDFADAVDRVYGAFATWKGKTRYGDKTPHYVINLDLLADLLPDARFVHVIRDGRNAALSYLESDFGPDSVVEAAYFWRRRIQKGRRSGDRLGPRRYREVRYEHLVDDPAAVLQELCGFIDLEFDPSMLRYYDRAQDIVGQDQDHRNVHLPPTKGLRKWEEQMSPGDVELFEAIAGTELLQLGYAATAPSPSVTTRARARVGWAGVQVHRIGYRTRRVVRNLGTQAVSPRSVTHETRIKD